MFRSVTSCKEVDGLRRRMVGGKGRKEERGKGMNNGARNVNACLGNEKETCVGSHICRQANRPGIDFSGPSPPLPPYVSFDVT